MMRVSLGFLGRRLLGKSLLGSSLVVWTLVGSSLSLTTGCQPSGGDAARGGNGRSDGGVGASGSGGSDGSGVRGNGDVQQTTTPSSGANAVETRGGPWFTDVTQESRIAAPHAATGAEQYFFPAVMTPGAAWLDYDQDGDLDIFLPIGTDPAAIGAAASPTSQSAPQSGRMSRLLRQEADHRFVDVTDECGLSVPMYGSGVAVGDVNNDGFPDVYVTAIGGDRLFVNDAGRKFADITVQAGIDNPRWGVSASFFDYDRDGRLDLFVTNYVDYDPSRPCFAINGQQDFCNPSMFPRTADKLYRNVTGGQGGGDKAAGGQGAVSNEATSGAATSGAATSGGATSGGAASGAGVRFEDVSLTSGIASKTGAGLGVACFDFNRDGWPDIYVANDGHANFLWLNQRDGTFREEAVLWGAAYDALGRGQGSMGVAVDDLNGDDSPDLLVTNLDGENNVLYASLPSDGFDETSRSVGLATPSYPFTGFGVAWVDVERDGDLDLVVVNGRVRRIVKSGDARGEPANRPFWDEYRESNHLYLNDGAGQFRVAVNERDGLLRGMNAARGLAAGDYDNDGDQDLLITSSGGATRLLRNDSPVERNSHWVTVRAVEPKLGGRDAYGARLRVLAGERHWTRWVNPGTSYASSHDPRVPFGLGDVTELTAVEVTWADGVTERFRDVAIDGHRTLSRGSGEAP